MIAYAIEKCLESRLFDKVIVSTDDQEIASISQDYGAEIPFLRSAENSNDFATTADVLLEVHHSLDKNFETFDFGCCIYPTSILLQTKYLQQGWEELSQKNWDSVLTVLPFSYPVQRCLEIKADDSISLKYPEFENSRSQDLENLYHDAGQFYWYNVGQLLVQRRLFMKKSGAIILQEYEAQDIDNYSDLKMAELKYNLLTHSNK